MNFFLLLLCSWIVKVLEFASSFANLISRYSHYKCSAHHSEDGKLVVNLCTFSFRWKKNCQWFFLNSSRGFYKDGASFCCCAYVLRIAGFLNILVPRAAIHLASATDRELWQGSKTGIPWIADFRLSAQPQKFETITVTIGYKNGQLLRLCVILYPARALDPWCWPKGSQLWGREWCLKEFAP